MERKKPITTRDPRRCNSMIDNCALHYKDGCKGICIKEIFDLSNRASKDEDKGRVSLILPSSVRKEALASNAPPYVKRLAAGMIYSIGIEHDSYDFEAFQVFKRILQGNSKSGKHDADAKHLTECKHHVAGYFITYDGRIHKKAYEIANYCELKIVTPEEFLETYRSFES